MDLIEARKLTTDLMAKHGLIELGWKFEYDNSRMRFGICRYKKKVIGLSRHLVSINSPERVKNTILHEIAHALTPGHGHDNVWREKAIELGCDGKRCYNERNTATPETKYIAFCGNCGNKHKRHRKPKSSVSCGFCSRTYNPTFILNYVPNPNFNK